MLQTYIYERGQKYELKPEQTCPFIGARRGGQVHRISGLWSAVAVSVIHLVLIIGSGRLDHSSSLKILLWLVANLSLATALGWPGASAPTTQIAEKYSTEER